ncbi:glycosyltransferase family 4 protein [Dietzia sp. SLG510A3-3B2-2]|nr:glycosyltransferase family 4 protein [Dietzia sp. SLG510A3-40A3]MBB1008808.1 glycosyltransferase family 4 protein [Dietzia sp. SLG510A3-3B2-2]
MKITFVSQWYPPENIWVPQAVVNALRAGGHEVTVITGVPHYPSGKVASGYRTANPHDEIIDGITVLRVPEIPYRGTKALGRLASYASFAVSATVRALLAARNAEVIFVYASPATSALPAMALKILAKVPYILQVQDVWPDSVVNSGFIEKSRSLDAIGSLLGAFVSVSYRMSSKVLVISPSAHRLLEHRGVPSEKLELLFNWADDPLVALANAPDEGESLRAKIGIDNSFRVFFYAGAMGPAQALATVISAFSSARVANRASLVLVGTGVEFDALSELSRGVDGVHVLSSVPLATARRWTKESDVGIVSLADTELHRSTFPSKIQFLTGMGVPLLVRAPGDTSELAGQTGSGVGVSSYDTDVLAAAFRTMTDMPRGELDSMGKSSRRWYEQYFDPRKATTNLNRVLAEQ